MNKLYFLLQKSSIDMINYNSLTEMDLLYDVFYSDIYIVINDILMGYNDGVNTGVPILDFLWEISCAIEFIDKGERKTKIEITESDLYYELLLENEIVIISSNWSSNIGKIQYVEFRKMAVNFIFNSTNILEDNCPFLLKNISYLSLKHKILSRVQNNITKEDKTYEK